MCSLFVRNIKPTSGLDFQLSGAKDDKNQKVHSGEDLKAKCLCFNLIEADMGNLEISKVNYGIVFN